mmetsp:Transcript_34118/g.74904  ORF Transcript_34118/g.74904 Transcript_34118/m.74904 type:complete len:396 (+) Transcript_34118:99-1286(+)
MTVLMNGSSRAFCGASSLLASLRTHAQAPMRMMHAAAAPMGGVRLPRTPTKLASVASIRQSKHAECISLLTTPPFHTPSRGVAKVPRRRAPVAWAKRAPFQQKNKLRDNYFVQRHLPAVPQSNVANLEAWLSTWRPLSSEDSSEVHNPMRVGIVKLRPDVWDMPLRSDLIHRIVLWQRSYGVIIQPKGKTRGQVTGGGRKPRPQKGTGKSRIGSIRAPHWRHGGRAFPRIGRSVSYEMPSKVIKTGIRVALSDKYRRNALIVIDEDGLDSHKTGYLIQRLNTFRIEDHKVLIVCKAYDPYGKYDQKTRQINLQQAAGNLPHVKVNTSKSVNVYDLVRSSVVVISKEALAELEERLQLHSTPNKLPMQIYRFMPEVAAAAIEEAKATAVAIASAQI